MSNKFQQLAFTPNVLAAQKSAYGRTYDVDRDTAVDPLGLDERAFIEARDSFFMATVSESGWPYVQHRGGPAGFVRAIDESTLAFADLRGNRQLVSVGNLASNDRVAAIFVDFAAQQRLKLFARAELVAPAARPELAALLTESAHRKRVERLVLLHVVGFDWNCPQHITPRYTLAEVEAVLAAKRDAPTR